MGIDKERSRLLREGELRGMAADRLPVKQKAAAGIRKPGAASRTKELTIANLQLTQEIEERRKAQASLQSAYAEIKHCRDRLQTENIYLQQEVSRGDNFGEIVGESGVMLQLERRVEQVAVLQATVLLRGEAGTGKKVVARAIHNKSERRERPMITFNLAALPENLMESELFGWERGECSGSDTRQIGRFELADAGTILLEEIDEMPLNLQERLLRLIRDGELERLGSPRAIKVDVRIIMSSSRDLEREVREGRFRADLFNRVKVFSLTIPPLRERKKDIPLLVRYFMDKHDDNTGAPVYASSAALGALTAYCWPGNLRELEGVVEREVLIGHGGELQFLNFRASRQCAGE